VGTDGLWSKITELANRECSLKGVIPPAARQFSKMGEQDRGQRKTERKPNPEGLALPTERCCPNGTQLCAQRGFFVKILAQQSSGTANVVLRTL
jgi:hypothetical protein